ncbi:MAG: response regulator [Bacteroidia bacterium]|nr:response regulator [Bacteroidia bacterium]
MLPSAQTKNVSVFIVEDSPIVVERLENIIKDLPSIKLAGKAATIESALMGINMTHPTAVILDIHLKDDAPDHNGIDLIQILRKSSPNLVIIMLTNMSSSKYKEKCLQLGANFFLDKSIDFTNIADILESLTY